MNLKDIRDIILRRLGISVMIDLCLPPPLLLVCIYQCKV